MSPHRRGIQKNSNAVPIHLLGLSLQEDSPTNQFRWFLKEWGPLLDFEMSIITKLSSILAKFESTILEKLIKFFFIVM